MSGTDWQISGEYMESCNCDYLCPCIYTNPQGEVTHDHCTAALIFRIDKGQRGGTDLAGLCFALVIRSGKIMADGNWVFAGVVDERADAAQRAALSAIVGGEAGGPPGMIRSNLVSDFRGVEFKPIEFKMEGLKRSVVDSRRAVLRDRGRAIAQPQRRAVLYRQHGASGRPASGSGAHRATPCSRLRARSSTWWARATTGISRRLPGRRRRRTCAWQRRFCEPSAFLRCWRLPA